MWPRNAFKWLLHHHHAYRHFTITSNRFLSPLFFIFNLCGRFIKRATPHSEFYHFDSLGLINKQSFHSQESPNTTFTSLRINCEDTIGWSLQTSNVGPFLFEKLEELWDDLFFSNQGGKKELESSPNTTVRNCDQRAEAFDTLPHNFLIPLLQWKVIWGGIAAFITSCNTFFSCLQLSAN